MFILENKRIVFHHKSHMPWTTGIDCHGNGSFSSEYNYAMENYARASICSFRYEILMYSERNR
ncbi:hypothetical protein BX666DRAFT_1998844 [Dichotomocladium elegans]|nr:hypothetical protein BX666DRAFT_1998844 [Dichotomocladium elegans]